MHTFARLIRRYVLAAIGILLFLVVLFITSLFWFGYHAGFDWQSHMAYGTGEIADAMLQKNNSLQLDDVHTPEQWMEGYSWAMVLDDSGRIIWQYQLPEHLNHSYTTREVAGFSRWYLDGYPVFCHAKSYGLCVIALPPNSICRYSVSCSLSLMTAVLHGMFPAVLTIVFAILFCCLLFSWQGARSLQNIERGLDTLSKGEPVSLPVSGFTSDLAKKLNQTSAQLQKRNEIISRRDTARTNWIAGVSHDIRTPLSLILGWAEQLEHDTALSAKTQQKAQRIRIQSEKIRSLIEDLNLTSKLQYGAQPLRCHSVILGPFLRRIVAEFYDSPLANGCTMDLQQAKDTENCSLCIDSALMTRAIENLFNNSIRHNAAPVHVTVQTQRSHGILQIIITDTGTGYPPAVLHGLVHGEGENTPHILGLHIVEQIMEAHGGEVRFTQNVPNGAKTILTLPLT